MLFLVGTSNETILPAGSVPWKVHRHRLHAAVLQAHVGQEADSQRPGVHRPGVLQLHHVGQVSGLLFYVV